MRTYRKLSSLAEGIPTPLALDDALAAAADESSMDETEAGGAGTADEAGGRDGATGARKRHRQHGQKKESS